MTLGIELDLRGDVAARAQLGRRRAKEPLVRRGMWRVAHRAGPDRRGPVHMLAGPDHVVVARTRTAELIDRRRLQEVAVRPAVRIVAAGAVTLGQRGVDDALELDIVAVGAQRRALPDKAESVVRGALDPVTRGASVHCDRTVQGVVIQGVRVAVRTSIRGHRSRGALMLWHLRHRRGLCWRGQADRQQHGSPDEYHWAGAGGHVLLPDWQPVVAPPTRTGNNVS